MQSIINWRGNEWISLAIRLYIGGLFLAACFHKILNPMNFALDIATYQMTPLFLINIMAVTMPWIELFVGIMLISGFKVKPATLLALGMMLMFTIAKTSVVLRGMDMSCGCFASSSMDSDPITWKSVTENFVYIILLIYVLILDKRTIGIDRFIERKS